MKKLNFILPFIALTALLSMLWYELFYGKTHDIPSPLIGEDLPIFSLPTYTNGVFSSQELRGHVSLLNIFASWCYACSLEANMLLEIKNNYHVRIYGINYKDKAADVENWLKKYGNPYVTIGNDARGKVAIDLGIYGTPETFVVNKQGKIIYRHAGAIDKNTWDNILYPLIKKYDAL